MKPLVKLIFTIFLVAGCISALNAQRAIPDDNLAYPVLITLSDCKSNIVSIKGSGFLLRADSDEYLVTARHVIFDENERLPPNAPRTPQCSQADLISYSKNPSETAPNHYQVDLRRLYAAGKIKRHDSKDVTVVQIGTVQELTTENSASPQRPFALTTLPEVRTISNAPSGGVVVTLDTVKKFADVLTSNDIYVLGYPSSIGIEQIPQLDYQRPLLRKGIVAGVNYANKTLVLDCLTFFGNSGGPVLQIVNTGFQTHYYVVGIVSQYVPFAEFWQNATMSYGYAQLHNSGYSIAEPMDSVLELIGR